MCDACTLSLNKQPSHRNVTIEQVRNYGKEGNLQESLLLLNETDVMTTRCLLLCSSGFWAIHW